MWIMYIRYCRNGVTGEIILKMYNRRIFFCVPVNSYGHVETASYHPNHCFSGQAQSNSEHILSLVITESADGGIWR